MPRAGLPMVLSQRRPLLVVALSQLWTFKLSGGLGLLLGMTPSPSDAHAGAVLALT